MTAVSAAPAHATDPASSRCVPLSGTNDPVEAGPQPPVS
jgi:hypothetical protein